MISLLAALTLGHIPACDCSDVESKYLERQEVQLADQALCLEDLSKSDAQIKKLKRDVRRLRAKLKALEVKK